MRVNRGLLYTGIFLVAIGAVLVAADVGAIDTARLTDALRLWPLAVIAIGASLVLRRSRFSLQGGMLAAALPGLILGGAIAVAPDLCARLRCVNTRRDQAGRATHDRGRHGPVLAWLG